MKRVTLFALVGAIVFSILSTWLGPMMIGWYVTPADQPAMLSCQAAVVGAMHRLVVTQMIGTLIGLVAGFVLGVLFRKKDPPATVAPAALPVSPSSTTKV